MKEDKEETTPKKVDNDELFPNLLDLTVNTGSCRKKDQSKKKRRKSRKKPYSAKNFLDRPKINAPANTTQFLCADKEYYLIEENLFSVAVATTATNSESDFFQSSASSSTQSSETSSEFCVGSTAYDDVFLDANDDFFIQEFERMYDDIRVELLCNKTTEELTSQCLELETAVHNLQYLLQREVGKRQRINEMRCLMQANAKLTQENEELRRSRGTTTSESQKE